MSQEPDVADLIPQESFVIPSVPLEVASFERDSDQQEERVNDLSFAQDGAAITQNAAAASTDPANPLVADASAVEPTPGRRDMQEQLEMDLPDGIPNPILDGRMSFPEFPEGMDMEHSAANEPPDLMPAFDTPEVMNPDGTPVVNNLFTDEMLEPDVPTEARFLMGEGTRRSEVTTPKQVPPIKPAADVADVAIPAAPAPTVIAGDAPGIAPARGAQLEPKEDVSGAQRNSASVAPPSSPDNAPPQKIVKDENLVFEYGPLASFAHQIGNLIDQNAADPNGAMKLRDTVNRLISVSVQENPTELFDDRGIPFPDSSDRGLNGRLIVLTKLRDGLGKAHRDNDSAEWAVKSSDASLVKLVETAVVGEIKRIDASRATLQHPSMAEAVLGGVVSLYRGFVANGEKAADVREYRNHQLNESLTSLERLGNDFKDNTGNPAWLAESGPASMKSAKHHRDRIVELSSDLSGRLDQGLFNKRLNGISELFDEAESTTDDEKTKKELAQMVESITEMVKRLAEKVEKLFQSVRKPQP